ncbi:hypothetical protein C7C46_27545 [Streptomyces tateyamensis]|uniref:SMI1/KNR4 family protein n=1 Tax=Streptomyces tateyamensis TaxID=565073 RepID=A0A2V4MV42_9ACTN|nr:SMI1/KNR4 family protein [Streptomyces tateyamensis]PYC70166.1 hypothetical protein C7C46_27545 [Streptomyces tateyamensis]
MVTGPDVAAALRGGVPARRRAWELVRWFAAEWVGRPLQVGDGYGEAELAAEEVRLGFALPAALREGYALFGRRDDLVRRNDPLRPLPGLWYDAVYGGLLGFRDENQGCTGWAVALGHGEADDPPVWVDSDQGWVQFLPRLSQAWVELVLSETLFAERGAYNACELPAAKAAGLAGYSRVELPDHPMWTGAEESPVRWYAAPGRLLRRDGVADLCWMHARGRTDADLDRVRADFPVRWAH